MSSNNNPPQPAKKITAKRQKHLDRQAKKLKNLYTKEQRRAKIDECINKLSELQLYKHYNEDTVKIYDMLEDFVENGTAYSGNIPIEGTKRVFWYMLNNNKKHEITTWMKYDSNV